MDHVQDLLALLAGGVLEQVSYLRRLEPAHSPKAGPGPHAGRVPDQRLEGLPGLAGVASGATDQTEEASRSAGVKAVQHQAFGGLRQLDVPGADEFGVCDINEPMTQDVLPEQDLALPALKAPEVHLGLGQEDSAFAELRQPVDRQVDPLAAYLGHQPRDQWQITAPQPHDDVIDLSHHLVGGGEHV